MAESSPHVHTSTLQWPKVERVEAERYGF